MVHWTQKYDQGVAIGLHEDYPIHCYDERYKIIATPINSNRFTYFDLKKERNVDLKN